MSVRNCRTESMMCKLMAGETSPNSAAQGMFLVAQLRRLLQSAACASMRRSLSLPLLPPVSDGRHTRAWAMADLAALGVSSNTMSREHTRLFKKMDGGRRHLVAF